MSGLLLSELMAIERRREMLTGLDIWYDGDENGDAIRADFDALLGEIEFLRNQIRGHCDRIAAQSELLSKQAEGPPKCS